jgi:hypothetical protein
MPVAKALSWSLSLELRHGDAARDAEVLQDVVEPRLFRALHLPAAGQRVDHALMEVVGNDDPERGADGREWRRLNGVGKRQLQQRVEVGGNRQRLGGQCTGIDQHIDEEEQAGEQCNGPPPIRLDVTVETVSGHDL